MSDFDPVVSDTHYAELSGMFDERGSVATVHADDVPKLVANELRRIYTKHGDPGLYLLVMRAQELELL